ATACWSSRRSRAGMVRGPTAAFSCSRPRSAGICRASRQSGSRSRCARSPGTVSLRATATRASGRRWTPCASATTPKSGGGRAALRGGKGRSGGMSSGGSARPAAIDPDFWRDRRVLVTGDSGFKGAWLALWLQSLGARVTGFSVGVPTQPSLYELARVAEGMERVVGDVRDPEAIASAVARAAPEIVIHMAAQSLVRRSFTEPRETYETNVMGTVNLLDAVRRTGDRTPIVLNL